jgi:predicted butyrate kinase (DUF1464 family)
VPRVAGVDLGTISIDICGLHDGHVFLESSIPTADALAAPEAVVAVLSDTGPLDAIVGPSGFGLPLTRASALSEADLRLVSLAADGEAGGIRGFRSLLRAFASSTLPVWLTPGVIHLQSVPEHRKINRVDIGTADKVCACALAIQEQSRREGCLEEDVTLILLEMGGAFSAGLAVRDGQIVDGMGGTSGPIGLEAAGALDGEVAYLAGMVAKDLLFSGGAASVGRIGAVRGAIAAPLSHEDEIAWSAYIEGAAKAVASLSVSVPGVRHLVLSGRLAGDPRVREELTRRLAPSLGKLSIHALAGFSRVAKQGAQGAALIADGLVGGAAAPLVARLGIREASGSVLDHLYVISAETARARLGIS